MSSLAAGERDPFAFAAALLSEREEGKRVPVRRATAGSSDGPSVSVSAVSANPAEEAERAVPASLTQSVFARGTGKAARKDKALYYGRGAMNEAACLEASDYPAAGGDQDWVLLSAVRPGRPVTLLDPEGRFVPALLRRAVGRGVLPSAVQAAPASGRWILERVFIARADAQLALIERRDVRSGRILGLTAVRAAHEGGGAAGPHLDVLHHGESLSGELRRIARLRADILVPSAHLAAALDPVRDGDARRYDELERLCPGAKPGAIKPLGAITFQSPRELNEYLLRTQEGISHDALEQYRRTWRSVPKAM